MDFDIIKVTHAFSLSPIIKNFPQEISCGALSKENLFIISSENIFSAHPLATKENSQLIQIQNNSKFQKLQIDGNVTEAQLIQELNIMIVLSKDNRLFYFNIHNPSNIKQFGSERYVNCFALDLLQERARTTNSFSDMSTTLCMGTYRSIKFYKWEGSSFVNMDMEVSFKHTVHKLLFINKTNIIIGFKTYYYLVQIKISPESKKYDVFEISHYFRQRLPVMYAIPLQQNMTNWPPFLGNLSDSTLNLLTKKGNIEDSSSMPNNYISLLLFLQEDLRTIVYICDPMAKITQIHEFVWSENPFHIEYSFPYMIGFLNSGKIEIRYGNTFIQNIQIESYFNDFKVIDNSFKNFQSLYQASSSSIMIQLKRSASVIAPAPFETQIENLVDEENFEIAYQLSRKLDPKMSNSANLKSLAGVEYGYYLFRRGDFKLAIDILYTSNIRLIDIIVLFPGMLTSSSLEDDTRKTIKNRKFPPLVGKAFETGIGYLADFLSRIRKEILYKAEQDIPLMNLIDTTLVKCYIFISPSLVSALFNCEKNFCLVDGVEESLRSAKLYKELVLLYRNNHLHHKAVQILDTFSNNKEFVNFISNSMNQWECDSIESLLIYVDFLLKKDPTTLISILIELCPRYCDKYRLEICQFMSEKSSEYFFIYLDKIVNCWKDTNPWYHNKYVIYKSQHIQKLLETFYTNENQNYVFPGTETSDIALVHQELIDILLNGELYEPKNVLDFFQWKYFYMERSIILARLNLLNESITVYLNELRDVSMAEKFCDLLYKKKFALKLSSNECGEGYYSLIMMCLELNVDGKFPFEKNGTELFFRHANRMAIVQLSNILYKFPQSYSIKELAPVVCSFLPINTYQRNTLCLYESISERAFNLSKYKKALIQSACVIISEDSSCRKCRKAIGLSAFVREKNGKLIHQNCANQSLALNLK